MFSVGNVDESFYFCLLLSVKKCHQLTWAAVKKRNTNNIKIKQHKLNQAVDFSQTWSVTETFHVNSWSVTFTCMVYTYSCTAVCTDGPGVEQIGLKGHFTWLNTFIQIGFSVSSKFCPTLLVDRERRNAFGMLVTMVTKRRSDRLTALTVGLYHSYRKCQKATSREKKCPRNRRSSRLNSRWTPGEQRAGRT